MKAKSIFIALMMFCAACRAFADVAYKTEKHKDAVCGSFFEYETVSFADKKYKALERAVNECVKEMVQKDELVLKENEADFPQVKNYNAVESWKIVKSYGRFLNVEIVYWYYFGASPWYLSKSFTFDTSKNALVNLSQITGLSGEQIWNEILRQLREDNEMTESDENRLADVLENRERYVKELENQAFGFTDDGRILLSFDKADFFGKPDFEFYFDVRQ